tara:strand:+ start:669 stop:941 length:273 start_codon:yes stop_codon:yes gene_type:complete
VIRSTTKNIIKDWLNDRILNGKKIIKSHEFEIDLVEYGKGYWGVTKLPSAYSRAWRQIRASKDYDDIGVTSIRVIKTKSKEGTWELITRT